MHAFRLDLFEAMQVRALGVNLFESKYKCVHLG